MISADMYFEEAKKAIDKLKTTQIDKIGEAGKVLAESILNGGVVHIFGTGHSRAFAMEMAGRAGGLIPMHAIMMDKLAFKGGVTEEELRSPEFERKPEVAHRLWDLYSIDERDSFIIISNSGRNGAIVEFASMVKKKKMPLIVITSMEHSTRTTSRHPSGKRLYELGDIVIDNCGPEGDALIPVPGLPMKACSISSITGAFIAQGLTAEIVKNYTEKGLIPPLYISANIDGGDEHNNKLKKEYVGRIE